jgi:HSP20 family protein
MSILVREINNLLNSIPSDEDIGRSWRSENYVSTAYHVTTDQERHLVEVPLIGVNRDQVTIDVQDYVLTVTAKTESKSRFSRSFKQSWNLTKDSDVDNVSASLENGLLMVKVPRVKPTKKVVNVNIV